MEEADVTLYCYTWVLVEHTAKTPPRVDPFAAQCDMDESDLSVQCAVHFKPFLVVVDALRGLRRCKSMHAFQIIALHWLAYRVSTVGSRCVTCVTLGPSGCVLSASGSSCWTGSGST